MCIGRAGKGLHKGWGRGYKSEPIKNGRRDHQAKAWGVWGGGVLTLPEGHLGRQLPRNDPKTQNRAQ